MNSNKLVGQFRKGRWALGAVALLCAGLVQAAGQLALDGTVYQDVEVRTPEGEVTTQRVPAAKVVPGGEVVYEIAYTNNGDQSVTNVAIDNPVPPQLTFVEVEGAALAAVSVDGGQVYGDLADLTIAAEDGGERAAQPADVTHLRWVLGEIQPGSSGKVAFKARVK